MRAAERPVHRVEPGIRHRRESFVIVRDTVVAVLLASPRSTWRASTTPRSSTPSTPAARRCPATAGLRL